MRTRYGYVKVGKRTFWKDIKVGQAFYFYGCEGFGVKLSRNLLFTIDAIAINHGSLFHRGGDVMNSRCADGVCKLYVLPKSIASAMEALK